MENRLSFQELKAQKGRVITNLEAIKGGNLSNCHNFLSQIKVKKIDVKVSNGQIKGGSITIGIPLNKKH